MEKQTYLKFIYQPIAKMNIVIILNNEDLAIGRLEKIRVGKWMSWCLFLEKDCYLSASCQDEVREVTKKLNAKLSSQNNKNITQSSIIGAESGGSK